MLESIDPPLEADALEGDVSPFSGRRFTFTGLRGRQGFEKRLNLSGFVNSSSVVMVSISGNRSVFGDRLLPFQGSASMSIANVVPHDDGIVTVRGHIGWDRDLIFRLQS